MCSWVYRVDMELKLISLIEKTVNTGLRDVSNNALIVIRMMTVKMFWFFTFHNSIFTRSASFLSSKTRNPMNVVLSQETLIGFFDHTLSDKHNVDWMGQISKNGDESFGHFSSHIEILILILKKINDMWDLAIRSKMFHNLAINKEEDLDLIFREISINILIIQFNRSIEKGLPGLFWFGHFTDFDRVVKNFFDFDIMGHLIIKVNHVLSESLSQNRVDSFHGYFDSLDWGTWLLVKIF